MDTNNASAVDEYPLNFLIELSSLKNLAATSLALDLWHHNQLEHFRMEKSNYYNANFNCEQVLSISLPGPITNIIDERIRSMGRELQDLYESFCYFTIVRNNRTFLKFFDSFSYGPDGKMSSEQSARNILTMHELTPMKKFEIACAYWLEDEIRQIWPAVSNLEDLDKKIIQNHFNDFMHYWFAKMRNSPDEYRSQNDFILLFNDITAARNWTAVSHLLNEVSPRCQHSFISDLVKCYRSDNKYLLSKLNRVQVDYLLSNFLVEIITELTLDEGCADYALRIWDLVRNNIEAGSFSSFLYSVYDPAYIRYAIYERVKFRSEQAPVVLFELWIAAPKRLKIEFFDGKNVDDFFNQLSKYSRVVYQLPHNRNFFLQIFTDMPMEIRSRIWHQHWRKMVVHCTIEVLNDLLKLCLNEKHRIERFVEEEMLNFAQINIIMDDWFIRNLFDEMINYTKLCSWNENLVRGLRKLIFSTCIPPPEAFDLDKLIQLGKAIDKGLSNVDEANDLKRTILFTSEVQKLFHIKLETNSAKKAIYAIDRFLPTRRSPREKQLFLGYWRHFFNYKSKRIGNTVSTNAKWEEFLLWWVDNEDDLPMFKKSLPVDEIFKKLLMVAVLNLSSRLGLLKMKISEPVVSSIGKLEEFAFVGDFLKWYFKNEQDVGVYKRNKVENYHKMAKLNYLLSIKNECIVNHILVWFFNGNLIEIERFKENFKKNVRID